MRSFSNSTAPRKTPVLGAYLEGWRRVFQAPAIISSIFVLTLLSALPLGMVVGSMVREQLGSSVLAEKPAWNWDAGWGAEFAAQAQGIGRTLTHEIMGFGGTLKILSGILDHSELNPALAGAAVAYGALWLFLTGGILDRFARGRTVRATGFFAASGAYFVRLLRLSVIALGTYWLLFRCVHPLLFNRIYDHYTRDMTMERGGLWLRIAFYAVFLLLLCGANAIFDFAKVRMVVEDRRSVISCLGASMRFIRRRALRVFGLYMLNTLGFLMVLRVWLEAAPQGWDTVTWAFLVAQLYLLARIALRLVFVASEIVFFQGELAHAGYTARPPYTWPNSAAAEAIENLTKS